MSTPEPRPALGVDDPVESRQRRKTGWSLLAVPAIIAVINLDNGGGSYDFAYVLKTTVLFAAMSLYWLWMSSPRAGAARFEALITKNAVQAVPVALAVGALLALLFHG
jgi:hypothetical protein